MSDTTPEPTPAPDDEFDAEKRVIECENRAAVIGATSYSKDPQILWNAYDETIHALCALGQQYKERAEKAEREAAARKRALDSMERMRPLCPDHRDKQSLRDCIACDIEKAERERDDATGQLAFEREGHASLVRELEREIDELRAEVERLREYAERMLDIYAWGNIDGGDVQEEALALGIIAEVPGGYDPDKHGPMDGDYEPGERFYMPVWKLDRAELERGKGEQP